MAWWWLPYPVQGCWGAAVKQLSVHWVLSQSQKSCALGGLLRVQQPWQWVGEKTGAQLPAWTQEVILWSGQVLCLRTGRGLNLIEWVHLKSTWPKVLKKGGGIYTALFMQQLTQWNQHSFAKKIIVDISLTRLLRSCSIWLSWYLRPCSRFTYSTTSQLFQLHSRGADTLIKNNHRVRSSCFKCNVHTLISANESSH